MAKSEEKVKSTAVTQEGDATVVKEKTSVESDADTRFTVVSAVWWLVGALEVLLAFRFVLKLLGANPNSGFTEFIYALSGFFAAPFTGIFSSPTTEGDITTAVFETATVVAMVVYALVGWGVVKLLSLNKKEG